MRWFSLILCQALLAVLLTGCAGRQSTPPSPPPAEVRWPTDRVVLQFQEQPGFEPLSEFVDSQIPKVRIWGNGYAVFATPDHSIRTTQLSADQMRQLMAKAAAIYSLQQAYREEVTDGGSAIARVELATGRKEVTVYPMNLAGLSQATARWPDVKPLAELWAAVQAALPASAPLLQPASVEVRLMQEPNAAATDVWPADLQGWLIGEQARQAVDLGGLGQTKLFRLPDGVYRVFVRPELPEALGPEEPTPTGPPALGAQADDGTLAMQVRLVFQGQGAYYNGIALVRNHSDHGVNILYDCGTQVTWEGLKETSGGAVRACPGVHSSLLEAGHSLRVPVKFEAQQAADWGKLAAVVRWEDATPGQTPPAPKAVRLELKPVTP